MKSPIRGLVFFFVLILAISVLWSSAFIIPEGRQVILVQFGKPVGKPLKEAGLYWKIPWIQEVRYVDKRILIWDGIPNQIPTKDKKYILVDTTARWKIVNALKFIQTVRNERRALRRLDGILESATRDVISNHPLVEVVRPSNAILDRINMMRKKEKDAQKKGVHSVEEEVFGKIEPILVGREKLIHMIAKSANREVQKFGITIIGVQLRRLRYEESVQKKVYERMISERKRIAEKIRSIGKGEQAKIYGKMNRDLQKIRSSAYRKAQIIRGTAEAKATAIYARAFKKDPTFYRFIRTVESYQKVFSKDKKAQFIFSTKSPFLNLFQKRP